MENKITTLSFSKTKKQDYMLPKHPFWIFSLQIYEKEQPKSALLALQNRHGLNINVLLFCCWYAANNQGQLTKADIKQVLTAIHNWHERIVLNLRQLRDKFKKEQLNHWQTQIRSEILAVELTAEHIEQLFIIEIANKKINKPRRQQSQRALHACQNMVTYTRILFINLDLQDANYFSEIIQAIFPELNATEAQNLCRAALFSKISEPPEHTHPQLQLKLQSWL